MIFEDRYVLIRGNKVNNNKIRNLRPELFENSNILSYWKLTSRYFLVDLLTNTVLIHFKFLTSANTGHLCDTSSFTEYTVSSTKAHYAIIEKMCFGVPYWGNTSIQIEKVYEKENNWFLIEYKFLGEKQFVLNSKVFIDFEDYFKRENKIDRFLRDDD